MKKLTGPVFVIDYGEFDKMVQENFNWPEFEIVAREEMNNGDDKLYINVSGEPVDYEREDMIEFLDGDRKYVSTNTILNALCKKGVIQEGNYIIEVWW